MKNLLIIVSLTLMSTTVFAKKDNKAQRLCVTKGQNSTTVHSPRDVRNCKGKIMTVGELNSDGHGF